MITNIKITLNENATVGFFTNGIAKFTTDSVANGASSDYLPDYLGPISEIKHKTDIKWKGGIEDPVEFSFKLVDDGTISGMIGSNYSLSGAKVEVFVMADSTTVAEKHVFYIDRIESDETLKTIICVNQAYLTNVSSLLANSNIKLEPAPNSFKQIFTSTKSASEITPCIISEIGDNRNSGGVYYHTTLVQTSSVEANYMVLRSFYSAEQSNYIGKDVRVVLSNKDNIIGGKLESVTIDTGDTRFAHLRISDIGSQIDFSESGKPVIDTLTYATLESNIAVYALPANLEFPITVKNGESLLVIESTDSRYNASTNTLSIPAIYSVDSYSYFDPIITGNFNVANVHARYYPDAFSYMDVYEVYEGVTHYYWDNARYPSEHVAIDANKAVEYIQDPNKAVLIYCNDWVPPHDYNKIKLTLRLTETIKKAIKSGEKWGVGYNLKAYTGIGIIGTYPPGTLGYYEVKQVPLSDTLGNILYNPDGSPITQLVVKSTIADVFHELYGRDLDDSIPRYPSDDELWNPPWYPETSTRWIDIDADNLDKVDTVQVEIWIDRFNFFAGIYFEWVGIVVKNKTSQFEDAAIIVSNDKKADLVSQVYGSHGITVSGTGKKISYAASNISEREALKEYCLETVDLANEVSGDIAHNPLSSYNATATQLANIIESSLSELVDVELMDYCNLPTFKWTNKETFEDEEIYLDLSMATFEESSSVIYNNPEKVYLGSKPSDLWTKCKNASLKYGLTASQDIRIYAGTLEEAFTVALDIMDYASIRRKSISLKVAYQSLTLGQRVKLNHPKISRDYDLYGNIESISLNPETGVLSLSIVCDMLKGVDTLFF